MRSSCIVQVLALALFPLGAPAWAQPVPSEAQRTVEFYVQHPGLRARVNAACLNDPGHLRNAADCWNAHRADLVASARQTHEMAGDTSDPRSPAYWTKRPNERRFTLTMCSHMTPEHARADPSCAPAEASMQAEQRSSTP